MIRSEATKPGEVLPERRGDADEGHVQSSGQNGARSGATATGRSRMRITSEAAAETPVAWLEVGGRRIALEADRIHVLGSGEQADVRLVHASIAPSHATLCFHRGRFIVETVGDAELALADGTRVRGETTLSAGATLAIGALRLEFGIVADEPAHPPRHGESGFAELMAHELRRAPWFALSIALHALVFLLLWVLLPPPPPKETAIVRFDIQDSDGTFDTPLAPDAPEPELEVQEPPAPEIEPQPILNEAPPLENPEPFDAAAIAALGDSNAMFERITGESAAGDIFGKGEGQRFSAGFRKTVAGLRLSGLEIVFAFDSTGSMGPVLQATKQRMTRMVRALHALVPDARIGVVTYRDHGEREDYLTRSVPLDRDLYRSLAFVQTVDADGGGDRPEAVLEALDVAMKQSWGRRARRVIVVIGDAPAHRETEGELERRVRRFCQDGNGYVHAIITSSDTRGQAERDVQRSFARLAKAGRGACVNAERDESILRQVLSLAVGAEFRDNVDKVFELVEERENKVSTRALDLARRAESDEIRRELTRPVLDDDVIEALARSNRPEVAKALVAILRDDAAPAHSLHAASFALQRILAIGSPLVDPEKPAAVNATTAERLLELSKALR